MKEYQPSKMRPIVQIVARIIKENPTADYDFINTLLGRAIPGWHDRSKCVNCSASMAQYITKLDVNIALLLVNMGRIVKERTARGVPFTEANRVRVSAEPGLTHTQKCQVTKASKLALVAKAGGAEWSITRLGYAALRGEPVPRVRITYRKQIIERPEDVITFPQVFSQHRGKMEGLAARRKQTRNDHRQEFAAYNPSEYAEVAGYEQGALV